MAFNKKTPPIRIKMDGHDFNKILNLIEEDNNEIKEKLMKYTFVHEDNQVELRLFSRETECIFLLILNQVVDVNIHYDYYEELKNNRIEYRKQFEKGGDFNA